MTREVVPIDWWLLAVLARIRKSQPDGIGTSYLARASLVDAVSS
jgi:hypothetical protein